jgi:hypothetical protein
MPRYYCDYCDMYLSHDSAGGRKEHTRGWKHRDNVMAYFKPMLPTFLQSGQGNAWQGWQQSLRGGQGAPPLPPGWEQCITGEKLSKFEKNRPYYVHRASGRSTWTHPALLDSSMDLANAFEKPWEAPVCPPATTPMAGGSGAGAGGVAMPHFQQQPQQQRFFQQHR